MKNYLKKFFALWETYFLIFCIVTSTIIVITARITPIIISVGSGVGVVVSVGVGVELCGWAGFRG